MRDVRLPRHVARHRHGGPGRQIGAAAQRNPAFGDLASGWTPAVSRTPGCRWPRPATTRRASCQPVTAHWLKVYPPGDFAAVYVTQSVPACGDSSAQLLTVMPVRSGNGKQGVTP